MGGRRDQEEQDRGLNAADDRPAVAGRLLTDLAAAVGDRHVLTDPAVVAGYLTDWTGRWRGRALGVVRPASTAETAQVMRAAVAAGAAIWTQGGNTGLVGGSVPAPDADRPVVLISTARLNRVGDVDVVGRTVGAGAGVPLARLQQAAADAGLAFGVDLAARDSATIGGMVATNAGGIHFVRHGPMCAQVLGIEAVLASGEILRRWSPLRKDNVGYDLPGLLAGSEGTLAVITGVLLRLVAAPQETAVAVVAVDTVAEASALAAAVDDAGLTLQAAELMAGPGLALVERHGHRRPFGEHPRFALLIETANTGAETLAQFLDGAGVRDAVVENGPAPALWALRETHTESIARDSTTPVVKLDVSVPLPALGTLIERVDDLAEPLGARHIPFGHVADGNLHVNLLDVQLDRAEDLTDRVLRVVADLGGSISAEHGVGRAKNAWIALGRSETDLATMRAIKQALDPAHTLNPGLLFP